MLTPAGGRFVARARSVTRAGRASAGHWRRRRPGRRRSCGWECCIWRPATIGCSLRDAFSLQQPHVVIDNDDLDFDYQYDALRRDVDVAIVQFAAAVDGLEFETVFLRIGLLRFLRARPWRMRPSTPGTASRLAGCPPNASRRCWRGWRAVDDDGGQVVRNLGDPGRGRDGWAGSAARGRGRCNEQYGTGQQVKGVMDISDVQEH